jgi:hypothetical protein
MRIARKLGVPTVSAVLGIAVIDGIAAGSRDANGPAPEWHAGCEFRIRPRAAKVRCQRGGRVGSESIQSRFFTFRRRDGLIYVGSMSLWECGS